VYTDLVSALQHDATSDDSGGDLAVLQNVDPDTQASGYPLPLQCNDCALTARQVRDLILRALI
jgi:hypothetical protein